MDEKKTTDSVTLTEQQIRSLLNESHDHIREDVDAVKDAVRQLIKRQKQCDERSARAEKNGRSWLYQTIIVGLISAMMTGGAGLGLGNLIFRADDEALANNVARKVVVMMGDENQRITEQQVRFRAQFDQQEKWMREIDRKIARIESRMEQSGRGQ